MKVTGYSYGNTIQVRWKILFYCIPQFIYESKAERIVCQSYRKNKSGTIFMDHGVDLL